MPTLAEILENKKDFPDDRKITLADGVETTLGEMRGGWLRQQDYTKKTSDLARERNSFAEEKSKFEQDKTEAEKTLSEMIEKVVTRGAPPQQQQAEWQQYVERDPLAKHLMAEHEQLKLQLKAIDERNQKYEQAIQNQQQQFLADQHRRALATLKSHDKELDETALVQYARDNAIPRLDLAYRLFTEDKRTKDAVSAATEKARTESYEKAKRELAQPQLPQRRLVAAPPENQPKTFDEAADAALRDPEILAAMEGYTP